MLVNFDKLPTNMQTKEVLKYYNKLIGKKTTLFIKRILDIFFSIVLLIFLAPIIIIISILIKITSRGPIFYKQIRITKYCKQFKILKFRTMIVDADKTGALVTVQNDKRITKVGKFLRKFRLDEIPQLINILIGDMSFIGTRPEVKKYVDAYKDEMMATLLLPAGLTSLASIEYRNENEIISKNLKTNQDLDDVYINIILKEKMKYNLEYFQNVSILNDVKILLRTVVEVFRGD